MIGAANNGVQATLDCAFCEFPRQWSRASDPTRSAKAHPCRSGDHHFTPVPGTNRTMQVLGLQGTFKR
jgi:hypothetical protein